MVDVHGCVFTSRRYTLLYIRYAKGAIYIQAWASALLVLTVMGITRASMRGTSDGMNSHAFFVYVLLTRFVIKGVGWLYCLRN